MASIKHLTEAAYKPSYMQLHVHVQACMLFKMCILRV